MVYKLAQYCHELAPTHDQHAIQALPADRPHETLGDGVGPRSPDRGPDDSDSLRSEDLVEAGRELGISVSNEPPRRDRPLSQHPDELAGLLGHPGLGRTCRRPGHMDLPGAVLDEEKDIEPAKEHGVHREEVTGQEGGRLGPEELTPTRARSRRRRLDAVALQDGPDARGRQPDAHGDQLAMDPPVAPGGVLCG